MGCGMCRFGNPGRALKKIRGHQQLLRWKDTLRETKEHNHVDGYYDFEDDAENLAATGVKRASTRVVNDFVVRREEELVTTDGSDDPFVFIGSLCPAGCRCRPPRTRKNSYIVRDRTRRAFATAPPPLEGEWLLV